jgi:hypothetical protein
VALTAVIEASNLLLAALYFAPRGETGRSLTIESGELWASANTLDGPRIFSGAVSV